jgi:Na+-driven multidrug efflux pump
VNVLLGDPRKAVVKLSIPIIVAMSVQTIYSLTDIWVAGLGADVLAAIGFAFSFFLIQMALTSGLGVAGGSAIFRRIGAALGKRNFKKAPNVIIYAIEVGFLVETVIAVFVFIFAQYIATVFTGAQSAAHIASELTRLLKIMTVFYPAVAFGMLSASFFQGAGKGTSALIATLLRSLHDPFSLPHVLLSDSTGDFLASGGGLLQVRL